METEEIVSISHVEENNIFTKDEEKPKSANIDENETLVDDEKETSLAMVEENRTAPTVQEVRTMNKIEENRTLKKNEEDVLTRVVKKQEADVTEEDVLTRVVKKQEAALRRLENLHGPGYGKPTPGSKSEARAQKYQASCVREIVELCGVVSERGYTDEEGKRAIRFQDLFNSYRFISDKCCGLLLRARKYKLLDFKGEMLFQGKDDNTVITMLRTFTEIHGHYSQTKQIIQPGEVYSVQTQSPRLKVRKKATKLLNVISSTDIL